MGVVNQYGYTLAFSFCPRLKSISIVHVAVARRPEISRNFLTLIRYLTILAALQIVAALTNSHGLSQRYTSR